MKMQEWPESRALRTKRKTPCVSRNAQIVGRLVENDQLAIEVHGPRNRHGLTLAARQRANGRRRGNVLFNAHLLEQGTSHIRHRLLVHAP